MPKGFKHKDDNALVQEALRVMESTVSHDYPKGNQCRAAEILGIPRATLQSRLRAASLQKAEFEYTPLPQSDLSFDELVAHRIAQFSRKRAYEDARRLIQVRIKLDGPIGIWHFGDPHIDDDGTDIGRLLEDARTVSSTEGLFGANVGDTQNNWVGRLARLWADQGTSANQAWILAEGFLRMVDWLYIIGGNHDAWSGAGDPIKWIQRGRSAPYMTSECRLELKFPNGNTCRINAHHDFAGHSQYNPAHGPMKSAMFGHRDHISVAGHKHISGHGVLKDPSTATALHSFLVAGYKVFDRFAMEKGFRDQRISPGVFTVIHPERENTHPDFVTFFWSMEAGVDYLAYARNRK